MQYVITAQVEVSHGSLVKVLSKFAHFDVVPSIGQPFEVQVTIPWNEAQQIWQSETRADFVFGVEAIRRLKGYLDLEPEVGTIIDLPTERALTATFRTTKYCRFLEDEPQGPVCKVAAEEDRLHGATTLHVCRNSCNLPDTHLLCSHAMHPETMSYSFRRYLSQTLNPSPLETPNFDDRVVVKAHCDSGKKDIRQYIAVTDVRDCQLGNNPCWELIYTPPQPSQEIPLDLLTDYVLMELDALNRMFKETHKGHQPFRILSWRISRDLSKSCTSQPDFMNNVSALASVLSDMSFRELLQTPPSADTRSISHLEQFLNEKYTQPEHSVPKANIVQLFKDINTLRLQYPVHPKTEAPLMEAHRRLGIPFPIDDHDKAWYAVMQRFLDALRQLRAMISQ